MISFSMRAEGQEWIDVGPSAYTSDEYRDCLRQLGRIGALPGADRAIVSAIARAAPECRSLLDVGCGGGALANRLACRFPSAQVVGLDADPEAIAIASARFGGRANLRFVCAPLQRADLPRSDVVVASLLCHHFDDEALPGLLVRLASLAKQQVWIGDLHRSAAAYALFACVARLFFRNRLIVHDGLLSIRKGFRRRDWERAMRSAGVSSATIKWRFAYRWIIKVDVCGSA